MGTATQDFDVEAIAREASDSEEVTISRDRFGYRVGGDFFRRVTTFCGGLPKPWLANWAAKEVAEFAYENIDAWRTLGPTDAKKLLKGAPWSKRDDAGDRGTAVHKALEAIVRGKPIPDDLQTEDELECAIAAEAFLEEFMDRPLASELTVFSRTYGYAGTLDLWCLDKSGVPWLLDYKTSRSLYPEHAVQQAAYLNAEWAMVQKEATGNGKEEWTGRIIPWGPDRVSRVGLVHVTPEGAALHEIRPESLPRLWTVFRAAAHVKKWQLDVDDYAGKTPREKVLTGPVAEVVTKESE